MIKEQSFEWLLEGCHRIADPSRAGVIIPVEQEENEDLLMLLMPMMLND